MINIQTPYKHRTINLIKSTNQLINAFIFVGDLNREIELQNFKIKKKNRQTETQFNRQPTLQYEIHMKKHVGDAV